LRNALAPINRIPPEILALLPDFWGSHIRKGRNVVKLTHVCQSWREIFISRSSLWTYFDCENAGETRVYLERSRSSPIEVWLVRDERLRPGDPFFKILPRASNHLQALFIQGSPENLQDITPRLSHPAPLLERLTIEIEDIVLEPQRSPAITAALFDGDLSSLRELCLHCIRTDLPWRNMVNLTSFVLTYPPPGKISTGQLLDFFGGAPHLQTVELFSVSLAPSDLNGRLISLARLKSLFIRDDRPISLLFGHLLIPAGAGLTTELEPPCSRIEDHLPRSLNNLQNLHNFTRLRLYVDKHRLNFRIAGPNGRIHMNSSGSPVDTSMVLESLAQLNTSTVKRLKIVITNPPSQDLPYQALLPMKDLRTLTISQCKNLPYFIHTLDPDMNSSNVVVCPKLEKLILRIGKKMVFDVESVIGMAAARAWWGAKLKSVRILSRRKLVPKSMSELRKHVLHLEYDSEDVGEDDVFDKDSDEED
jgi:hypothetical protein